jgi:hypothetical protein
MLLSLAVEYSERSDVFIPEHQPKLRYLEVLPVKVLYVGGQCHVSKVVIVVVASASRNQLLVPSLQ